VSAGDRDDVRRARDEIEKLEAARLRLSDAFMKGDRRALEEDRRLERRLRDLSRLIMRAERGEEEESRAETERRGEQLREGLAATPPAGGPRAVRREQQKKLSTLKLRTLGLSPDLVVRRIKGPGRSRPDARKKFVRCLTRNTTSSETRGAR
jgi:hypothetical protein